MNWTWCSLKKKQSECNVAYICTLFTNDEEEVESSKTFSNPSKLERKESN